MSRKEKKKQLEKIPIQQSGIDSTLAFSVSSKLKRYLLVGVAIVVVLVSVAHLWYAHKQNGEFGFTLDDPWIHLTFAKNLAHYGSFSYYKDEMPTAGSTSPLYTILLAFGFKITQNEMVLSYILGITFLILSATYLFKLALLDAEKEQWLGIAAVAVLVLEPHLHWIALSGMETTLFIFLLLAALYYYRKPNRYLLGISLGLMLWARPEAVILLTAIGFDYAYRHFRQPTTPHKKDRVVADTVTLPRKDVLISLAIFLPFAVGYVILNESLSGSVFPNTYAAKITYYASGSTSFLSDCWRYFSSGAFRFLVPFFIFSFILLVNNLLRRKEDTNLIYFLWIVGLLCAYWIDLPYLYQNGRYLMPAIPLFILVSIKGMRQIFLLVGTMLQTKMYRVVANVLTFVLLGGILIRFAVACYENARVYAEDCAYITERQVKAARWLKEHTPPNAVVATHDIGAIGFYSDRRVVDMVGLISPEMVEHIGDLQALKTFLIKSGATHVAVLRNWFEITNQLPLYVSDERYPEIMEIFDFSAERTHFAPGITSRLNEQAHFAFQRGDLQQAFQLVYQSLQIDNESAKTHFYLGLIYNAGKRDSLAEVECKTALRLNPEYINAYIQLGQIYLNQRKPQETIQQLEKIIAIRPGLPQTYQTLAYVYRDYLADTVKAKYYEDVFSTMSEKQ